MIYSSGMIEMCILILVLVWIHSANSYRIDDAYLGCFYDAFDATTGANNLSVRVLPFGKLEHTQMTIGRCITHCLELQDNIRYAGLEDSNECYCGTADADFNQGGHGRRPDGDCSLPCAGNARQNVNQTCGGYYGIAVYDLDLIRCKVPGNRNFFWNQGGFLPVQMNATFQCHAGYNMSGSNAAQCIFDDKIYGTRWEPDLPSCISENPTQSTTSTGSNIASIATNDYMSQNTTLVNDNTGTSSTEIKVLVVGALCGVATFGICLAVVLVIKYLWNRRSKENSSRVTHVPSQQADKLNAPFYDTIDEKGPVYATVNMDSNRSSVHSGDGDVSLHGSRTSPKGHKSTPVYSYADITIDSSDVRKVVISDRSAGDKTYESFENEEQLRRMEGEYDVHQ